MKILHLNTERSWRGGEQQALYLLQGLSKRGISSDLVCQPDSPMARSAGKAKTQVLPVDMHGEADLLAARRIRSFIRKTHYDVIHSHTSHAHTLAFAASLGLRVKRLVTRRVDFSIFRHSFLHLSGIKYRFMADYFIAISQKIKDVLVDDGIAAERIFVIHSGIDPQRFSGDRTDHLRSEFHLAADEKVVINVAHLAGHKGQKHLVRAIPHVLEKMNNIRFFIIGKGELMADLKRLAASLGLDRHLVFTGFRDDVGAFYNLADLFVMSSVQEGLGTAVLEALAAGKPVVAARSGGIPEIISDGETGRLVAPADPSALASGIIELLTHADLAQKMATQGQRIVHQQFSIDAMVDEYIQVYQRILKKSAH
jgi:glycosyltransferase involved in cell wall biosynthesis